MPKVVNEDEVFATTAKIYAECGYVNTSMKDIAGRAAINETTLFRRYGSKHALIVTALVDLLAKSEFGQVTYSGDVETDLMNLVSAYSKTNMLFGGAVVNLISDVPRHEELRPAGAVLMANLTRASEIIRKHQNTGKLVSLPPMVLLSSLISPIAMRAGFERAFGGGAENQFDPQVHINSFLRGYGFTN